MAGLYRFATGAGHARIDRDRLVDWARERFESNLSVDDLKNKQREEIRALLLAHSRDAQQRADGSDRRRQGESRVAVRVRPRRRDHAGTRALEATANCESLADWLHDTLRLRAVAPRRSSKLEREELEQTLCNAVEDRYRPEMRRMERNLLLSLVDTAWKDHLLAMDHLRSSVGLMG